MNDHNNELKEYITKWGTLNNEERIKSIKDIIKLLSDDQGFKSPQITIITIGPPTVRGFYDQSGDNLYVNKSLILFNDFKPVFRSLAHLTRYKGQVADVLKYLSLLQSDPSKMTDPQYENIRKLKNNMEKYLYPWGDQQPVDDEEKEFFWISTDEQIDWESLKTHF